MQIHQTDVFTVQLVKGATTVNGVVTAVSNGVYQVQYTLTEAGTYELNTKLQIGGSGSFYHIHGSPFTVVCSVSVTDPANTVISGTGSTAAIAGDVTEFIVTLHDSGNNQRTSGGDTLTVAITSTSHTITNIEVFDQNDGTYKVLYVVTDASETYTIQVVTNGDAGNAKSSTVTATHNQADMSTSTIVVPTPVVVDTSSSVTITMFDSYNNPIKSALELIVVEEKEDAKLYFTGVQRATPNEHIYDVTTLIQSSST